MDHLATQVHLLRIENEGLQQAVKAEKKRCKQGKPLFDQIRDENGCQAVFYSPKKIQYACDKQQEIEEKAQQEETCKEEAKLQKQLQKEEKEQLAAARRAERKEKSQQKAIEKAQKVAEVAARKEQRIINQQLKS